MKQLLVLFLLLSCDSPLLVDSIFVSKEDKERIDFLLTQAQSYLDSDDLDEAEKISLKAYNLNKDYHQSVKMLGKLYFEQSGLTIFDIAKSVNQKSEGKKGSSSSNQLSNFSSIIPMTVDDYKKLGDLDKGSGAFSGIEIFLPYNELGNVDDANSPRGGFKTIKLLNQVIKIYCPFISKSAISGSEDTRHSGCGNGSTLGESNAYFNFIFGLSHLLEAIIFFKVINYKTEDINLTSELDNNLMRRVNQIKEMQSKELSFADISLFTEAVLELKGNIDSILSLDKGSMLSTVFMNMQTFVSSLASIEGVPDSLIESIQTSLDEIKEKTAKVGGDMNKQSDLAMNFRVELEEKLASSLGSSISGFVEKASSVEAPAGKEADKVQAIAGICDAFSAITSATSSVKTYDTPAGC